MTAPLKARPAKPTDAVNLFRLLTEAYTTDDGDVYPQIDEERMLRWITESLCHEYGYVVVIENIGRIVGSLALIPVQYRWSAEWFLNTEWFYVQRRYRKNASTLALLYAAHAFADEHGASIVSEVSSAKDATLKDRLMQTRGYVYMGGTFIRRSENGILLKPESRKDNDSHTTSVG